MHRHGIVHGTITRFDNRVVATKAWNMLFAVVDWATATKKARPPETPKPTLRGVLRQMATTTRMKKMLEGWKPSRLSGSDARFEDHEVHALTVKFLTSWRERNFGALARFPSRQFGKRETTLGQMAGHLREAFDGFVLSEFRVTELENTAPAIWLSRGEATVNDSPGTFECRWTMEEADGTFGYGSDSAAVAPRILRPHRMAAKRIDEVLNRRGGASIRSRLRMLSTGRASNPERLEALEAYRGRPTDFLDKDLPAKSSQFSLTWPTTFQVQNKALCVLLWPSLCLVDSNLSPVCLRSGLLFWPDHFHHFLEAQSRRLLKSWSDMAVSVQGDGYSGVAQPFALMATRRTGPYELNDSSAA